MNTRVDETAGPERPAEVAGPLAAHQIVLIVAGAALGLAVGVGPVFLSAAGVFVKPIAAAFDWGRADVAVLPILGMIGTAIGAPCLGYIADRIGWRRVIALAILFLFLGLLAVAVAPASHAYIIAVGLFIGIAAAPTSTAGYIAVVSRTFDRRLGMALGFALVGVGIGGAVMPVIAGKLIEVSDWRQAYAGLAALSLVLGLIAHRLVFHTAAVDQSGAATGRESVRGADAEGLLLGRAIKSYHFWLIGGVCAISLFSTLGVFIHLVAYATDLGISPMLAAQAAGLAGLGSTLARIAIGFVLDRVFAPLIACATFLVCAAGLYLLTAEGIHHAWVLSFAAILVGVAHGADGDLLPFLAKRYFGVRAFGSIYGVLFSITAVGGAAGAYVFGWFFDALHSYTLIFQFTAALGCASALAVFALGPYRFAPRDRAVPDAP